MKYLELMEELAAQGYPHYKNNEGQVVKVIPEFPDELDIHEENFYLDQYGIVIDCGFQDTHNRPMNIWGYPTYQDKISNIMDWAHGNFYEILKENLKEATNCREAFDILTKRWPDIINRHIQEQIDLKPNPEWVKIEDLEELSKRLEKEFQIVIYKFEGDKFIAEYKGQLWDLATGEGSWTRQQGDYDYDYFPHMSKNLGHRLSFLTLRESNSLSRETVKSYLHRKPKLLSKKEAEKWFEEWLGNSSWKPKYWIHHDKEFNGERVSVVSNHAKDMLIFTNEEGVHIYSRREHILIDKLPKLFYKFAAVSLEEGKDYQVSSTGWALTW